MELESLRFFMETAKTLNITETADRLFVSQQTLSNHIRRVENYYGTPLFNRLPRLQLTPAGQEVLKYAEKTFRQEKELLAILADVANSDSGQVSIGVTAPRCTTYLPQVLKKYSQMYPKVKVHSIEALNGDLEKMVLKNKLDFAVCGNSDESASTIQIYSMHEDAIYFCVSDRLLYEHYGVEEAERLKKKSFSGADVADFARLPFMVPTHSNRVGQLVLQCFQDTNCTPNIYFSSPRNTMMMPLCNQGLCAGFTSHMNLSNAQSQLAADINVFPLFRNGKPVTLSINLIYHKQRYLNHFVKDLLKLTADTMLAIEHQDLRRLSGTPEIL